MRAMKEDALKTEIKVLLTTLVPEGQRTQAQDSLFETMPSLGALWLAIQKGKDGAGFEMNYLPSMRIGLLGSRKVVVVEPHALWTYAARAATEKGAEKIKNLAGAVKFMKDADRNTWKDFGEKDGKNNIWFVTTGYRDILFVPTAYVCYESVLPAADFIGTIGI